MDTFPVKVGILGLGRSGWDIHTRGLQTMPDHYQVVAACDLSEARRQEAAQILGCQTYGAYSDLLANPEVELVIVAPPSYLHAVYTVAALQAGKAVVCEKPMAANLADADNMIATAARTGSLLTMFQNRRYEPSYLKVREVITSGALGRIVEIKMTVHSFGRRWDWQTLKAFGGGQLRNNGVHFLDQALQLMDLTSGTSAPVEPQVFFRSVNALSLGDAEDSFKIILSVPGAPLVDFELSSACAYGQEPWLIMGTQGTLAGTFERLRWKSYRPEELLPRALSTEPTPGRTYNSDKIELREETWAVPPPESVTTPGFFAMTQAYYLDLYRTLREGAPLSVLPASVRRVMQVVEQCR